MDSLGESACRSRSGSLRLPSLALQPDSTKNLALELAEVLRVRATNYNGKVSAFNISNESQMWVGAQ